MSLLLSYVDYRGCLCRKLCVSLYFTTFNEAGAKLNNSDLQVNVCFGIKLFLPLIYFLDLQNIEV